MIKTDRNVIRSLIITTYIFIICVFIFLISSAFSYFNTGADRSDILHIDFKKEKQYTPKTIWTNDGNAGRVINQQTRDDIETNYLDAWHVRQLIYKSNSTIGVNDYYTEDARKNIINFVNQNKADGVYIDGTTLNHNLNIDFFSEDGQLVVLTDSNVVEYKNVYQDPHLITESSEISNYKVLLLLEDGFWKIRHIIKTDSKPLIQHYQPIQIDASTIKGINYYPQATPWAMFGDNFDITTINNDFKIIKKAGLNTIRIFIQYDDFGKANVDRNKLNQLIDVLDTAKLNGIKVIITLFDFYGNYNVIDWSLNQKHLDIIVSALKDHDAIIAWDIKNEPDLDFKSRGKDKVVAWLEHMILKLKSIDDKHPVTIGWSNTESASILKDNVDMVSFHYYKDLSTFEDDYLTLKKQITEKPIILQEFGMSSYSGVWKLFSSSKQKQANYHKQMQEVLKRHSIPYISWTLYDFKTIPNSVVGKLPWRKASQKKFGFITKDGDKKPSFNYIAQ